MDHTGIEPAISSLQNSRHPIATSGPYFIFLSIVGGTGVEPVSPELQSGALTLNVTVEDSYIANTSISDGSKSNFHSLVPFLTIQMPAKRFELSWSPLKRRVHSRLCDTGAMRLARLELTVYRLKAGCHTAWLQTHVNHFQLLSFLFSFHCHFLIRCFFSRITGAWSDLLYSSRNKARTIQRYALPSLDSYYSD